MRPSSPANCGGRREGASSGRVSAALRSLRLGPELAEAEAALRGFLDRRRWLRTTPDAPLQLVRVPAVPLMAPGASPRRPPSRPVPRNSNAPDDDAGSTDGGKLSSSSSSSSSLGGTDTASFFILRDDLLHPVLGGNKVRKLDGLVPEVLAEGVSDLVTCGGVQSAHLAAVAVVAAEAGLRSHLLVRGEPPQVPTGYHLVTRMYGTEVSYISRAEYADRQAMLSSRAAAVRGRDPGAQVAVISEGGGDPPALLGLLRLVHWMAYGNTVGCNGNTELDDTAAGAKFAAEKAFRAGCPDGEEEEERAPKQVGGGGCAAAAAAAAAVAGGGIAGEPALPRVSVVRRLPYATTTPYKVVVDAGTGTTAVGLALGIVLLGLPWSVHAVTLAGDASYYQSQQEQLLCSFLERYGEELFGSGGGYHHAAADLALPGRREVEPASVSVAPAATVSVAAAAVVSEATAVSSEGSAAATAADGTTAEVGRTALAGSFDAAAAAALLPLHWLPRPVPRRFGKVLDGEIAACKQIAQLYGIALDPIYSLAAWEVASLEAAAAAAADVTPSIVADVAGDEGAKVAAAAEPALQGPVPDSDVSTQPAGVQPLDLGGPRGPAQCVDSCGSGAHAAVGVGHGRKSDPRVGCTTDGVRSMAGWPAARVVMLHGGGALGLHGLAQRYPGAF